MSQLLDELRRKYRTPEAVVRALGLDAKLLQEPKSKSTKKPAQDAGLVEIATALATVAPLLPDASAAPGAVPGGLVPPIAPVDPAMAAVPPEIADPALAAPAPLPPVTDPVAAAAPGADPDLDDVPNAVDPDPVDPDDPNKTDDAGDVQSWLESNYPDIAAEYAAQAGSDPAPEPEEKKSDDTVAAKDEDPDEDEDKNPFAKDEDDCDEDPAKDRNSGGANRARDKRGATADEHELPPANTKGPAMQPPDTSNKPISKAAMDAAIASATTRERENQRAITLAQREVRPWVGEFRADIAFDSAPQVYKRALETLGVSTKGLHQTAYAPVLRAQPKPGLSQVAGARRPAQDSANAVEGSFLERFPGAANTMVG